MSTVAARCARCGRPVEPGEHLCAECREEAPVKVVGRVQAHPESELDERQRRWPPDMPRPSPVQYHATVMVTVALVLVGLALFAFLHHRGVGPFSTSPVRTHQGESGSVVVTFSVTNEGSHTARSTCRIAALDGSGSTVASDSLLTPPIAPGSTILVRHTLAIPSAAARFQARCS
jgi:hypothetical protein